MTPALEQKARQLLLKAEAMAYKDARYTFQIGDYWNICGEVAEFLEDLLDCRSKSDDKPMAAGHNNPLYNTEITI